MKIIVLGVATAFCLGRNGHRVQVVDAAQSSALGTSYANGGQLSYSYTEPLASPSPLPKLPALALGRDPALEIDPALVRWVAAFLRNCTPERELFNMRNVLRLALHSRELLHGPIDEYPINFNRRRSGKLHVYASVDDLEGSMRKLRIKNEMGCAQEILETQACVEREPACRTKTHNRPKTWLGDSYRLLIAARIRR